ncbi:MAG: FMN-binding protein, partial [Clostridia bacterium]|nr:FMN-binding protein [Clostridia bacterium]
VSIVFTGLLAGVNAAYKNKIRKNQETAVKSSILSSVGIEAADADKTFGEKAVEKDLDGMKYYLIDTDLGTAYAIPFEGAGLWGTIRGYIGVSSDFKLIKGLAFTEQNETPGLGGRIEEDWYKAQFKGTMLSGSLSYGEETGLDAITGATSTSNAVLKILNAFIETTLKELEEAADE